MYKGYYNHFHLSHHSSWTGPRERRQGLCKQTLITVSCLRLLSLIQITKQIQEVRGTTVMQAQLKVFILALQPKCFKIKLDICIATSYCRNCLQNIYIDKLYQQLPGWKWSSAYLSSRSLISTIERKYIFLNRRCKNSRFIIWWNVLTEMFYPQNSLQHKNTMEVSVSVEHKDITVWRTSHPGEEANWKTHLT